MSWWTLLTVSPSEPLADGTTGLILVDATLGPITVTLPSPLAGKPLYFVRRDASPNLVTLTPAAPATIVPAGAAAPSLLMHAGDAFALMPSTSGAWLVGESGMGVIIREATVAALIDYATLAGNAVESERVEDVPSGSMPRLFVYADEDAEGVGDGGTAPAFDMTLNLVVQALVERAAPWDARVDLDTLMIQARDCLLGDPTWLSLCASVKSVRTTRAFKGQQTLVTGDGRIQIAMTWTETYRPRVTTPLSLVTLATTPPTGTPPVGANIPLPPS